MAGLIMAVQVPAFLCAVCESASMATYRVPGARPGALFGDQAALSTQAAQLSQTAQSENLCGTGSLYRSVQILGAEQMARVLVLEASKEVRFLPCARRGDMLTCQAGTLSARINTTTGTSRFVEPSTNTNNSCTRKRS